VRLPPIPIMTNINTEKTTGIKRRISKLGVASFILTLIALLPLPAIDLINKYNFLLAPFFGKDNLIELTRVLIYLVAASVPAFIFALIDIIRKGINRIIPAISLFMSGFLILYFVISELYGPQIVVYFLRGIQF